MNAKEKKKNHRRIKVSSLQKHGAVGMVGNVVNIDVVNFVEARKFEIQSMENAIKSAKSGVGKMSFQLVPRHLRRRAASHNMKRVPLNWRRKEPFEKFRVPKRVFRRKRWRSTGSSRAQMYAKRQSPGKPKWLSTHVFHAKRMRMSSRWGYKIAESSRDKSIRAVYRAAKSSCLLQDCSYNSLFQISGPLHALVECLKSALPLEESVGIRRHLSGQRWLYGMLYIPGEYPMSCVGPVKYFWIPNSPQTDSSKSDWRTLCAIVHPAMIPEAKKVFAFFQERGICCSAMNELSVFSLAGPLAHQALLSALPLADVPGSKSYELFQKLNVLTNTSSLPENVLVGLEVLDPRVHFPPRYVGKIKYKSLETSEAYGTVKSVSRSWPDRVQQTCLWDADTRRLLNLGRIPESVINRKRGTSLIPGMQDGCSPAPTVPIFLLQETLRSAIPSKMAGLLLNGLRCTEVSMWHVVFPSSWARDFLKAFVFAGARLCALQDMASVYRELSIPYFPFDYPETTAAATTASIQTEELLAKWSKKPPAKRVNYTKLGVDRPFSNNYSSLSIGDDSFFVLNSGLLLKKFFLLLRKYLPKDSYSPNFFSEFSSVIAKYGASTDIDWSGKALVRAVVAVNSKGQPCEYGRLYVAPLSLLEKLLPVFRAQRAQRKRKLGDDGAFFSPEILLELDSRQVVMSSVLSELDSLSARRELELCGYVSSGGYSLNSGSGRGIAVLSFAHVVNIYFHCIKRNLPAIAVLKNQQSRTCRLVQLCLIP